MQHTPDYLEQNVLEAEVRESLPSSATSKVPLDASEQATMPATCHVYLLEIEIGCFSRVGPTQNGSNNYTLQQAVESLTLLPIVT